VSITGAKAGVRAVALCVAVLASPFAHAYCKTPLPDPQLRALDAKAIDDPVAAIADARKWLSTAASTDALRIAQLQAIVADAYDTTGDDREARAAVAAGRTALAKLRPSPEVDELALRLQLVEADTAETREDVETAIAALDAREPGLRQESLGRVCLLIVRGRVHGRLGHYEKAAKDGLLAYRLATSANALDARAEAAYQLGSTYRRAGLAERGLALADEVVAYARTRSASAMLGMALWQKSQVLGQLGRNDEALGIADESRRIAAQFGDVLSLAFAEHERCSLLVDLGRLDEAASACRVAEENFRAVHRDDQLGLALTVSARIDLARGRAQEALRKLDAALADGGARMQVDAQPRLHRWRAEALERMGRHAEAFAALRESVRLADAMDARQRRLAVAVLDVEYQVERGELERRVLAQQLEDERERAASRELTRRLAIGLAVGVALLAALLGALLVLSRRHARELRRQEMILRQTSENAPDALVLLDDAGLTRFANRGPFGGAGPEPGAPLADAVPARARPAVVAAIERLLQRREPVTLDIRLPATEGERYYEASGRPIVDDGRLIGATLRFSDVTDRRTLERQVLDAAARERRRIGEDLHEGLGQELAGLALQLGAAATAAQRGRPDAVAMIGDAVAQLDRTVASTRDLARGISPVDLARGSLSIALGQLAADAARRLELDVRATSTPREIVVPAEASEHLYRIALEAVANAASHARCRRIDIAMRELEGGYELTIDDDGIGLPAEPDRASGMGLRIVTYRARLLDGSVRFEKGPLGGARVAVVVGRMDG
jgi:PAS domain S-box-containing protein